MGAEEEVERECGSAVELGSPEEPKSPAVVVVVVLEKRRWVVLAVLCLLNASNSAVWLSMAPVTDHAAQFMAVKPDLINWLSLVYIVVCIPCGPLASWATDSFGLRFALVTGGLLNGVGALVRLLGVQDWMVTVLRGFPLVMTGQTVAALAQPLLLFAPTKVAAVWFPENQRAIANTIASMANPLGIMLTNVISPLIVHSAEQISTMLIVYAVPALLGTLLVICLMQRSAPLMPPSIGATTQSTQPFLINIKQLFTNGPFLILLVCFGTGIGAITCFTTLLAQILCARGYTDEFSGICGALTIAFGIVGAVITGMYVDRTKHFAQVGKINFLLASLAAIAFALLCVQRDQAVAVAFSCSLLGLFGFSIYSVCLEVGVECTYPVGEATSTGLLFVSGQIQALILILLLQALARPLSPADSVFVACKGSLMIPYDWTVSMLVFAGVCVLASSIFTLLFRAELRRRKAEEEYRHLHEPHEPLPATTSAHLDQTGIWEP
uniref:Solute carrier family 49 member 3 n=1 Tax=Eptatretus burgeri TaxID=7764 RepID=A0A8C4Q1I9_EPTBU